MDKIRHKIGELIPLDFDRSSPAKLYTFSDGKGIIGFISGPLAHREIDGCLGMSLAGTDHPKFLFKLLQLVRRRTP